MGLGLEVSHVALGVKGLRCRVWGLRFRVSGFAGFRVWVQGFTV